jgi:hypothetical protein
MITQPKRRTGPAGRGVEADHPDNLRIEAEAIAALRAEDAAQAAREDAMERHIAAGRSHDDGRDNYDGAEAAYQRMEAEDVGPHLNEWVR